MTRKYLIYKLLELLANETSILLTSSQSLSTLSIFFVQKPEFIMSKEKVDCLYLRVSVDGESSKISLFEFSNHPSYHSSIEMTALGDLFCHLTIITFRLTVFL
jgi:hypothetical protein